MEKRNRKQDLIRLKESLKKSLLAPLSNLLEDRQDALDLALEQEKNADFMGDFDINNYFNLDKIVTDTYGRTSTLYISGILPINHITRGIKDTTAQIIEQTKQYIATITSCDDIYGDKCYFINKPIRVCIEQDTQKNITGIYLNYNEYSPLTSMYREMSHSYFHPHCSNNSCCLGGYHTILNSAIKNCDIKSFIITLKRYLQSTDINDGWGSSLLVANFIFYDETKNKYYLIDNRTFSYTSYILEFTLAENNDIVIENLYLYTRTDDAIITQKIIVNGKLNKTLLKGKLYELTDVFFRNVKDNHYDYCYHYAITDDISKTTKEEMECINYEM